MALTRPIGFICYNNSELVRDGYIESVEATVIDADDFNFNKLKRNIKGVTYQLIRDDTDDPDKITSVIERRKLLPAEKIKIEIQFSKTLKNAVTSPIAPGSIPGSVGFLVGNPLAGIGFGGITSGFTDFVYDIIDSEMQINERIKITQKILDTGIIEFESFPVSIFAVVKEFQEDLAEAEDDDGPTPEQEFKNEHPTARIETDPDSGLRVGKVGLDFQIFPSTDPQNPAKQTDRIGQHSRGSYQGGPRKRIDGITNQKGQYGDFGIPFLNIVENQGDSGEPPEQEVVLLEGQENIFLEIIRDTRKRKFRGDNKDVNGFREYPIKNKEVDDVTDHNIRIKTDDLNVDDIVYITFLTASKRRVRQAMRHKGTVGQGNRFGVSGWNLEIGSEMDIFDFQINTWLVPSKVPDENAPDDEFKITFNQYKDWKIKEKEFDEAIANAAASEREGEDIEKEKEAYFDERFDELEGWRQSSNITSRLDVMWAADYRGILLAGYKRPAVVVFPASEIRDQEWFEDYLKTLPFVEFTEDPITFKKTFTNLNIKFDDDDNNSKFKNMAEGPIDIGSPANELNFDREKIPYYYNLGQALKTVSIFKEDDPEAGVGVPSLDVLLKQLLDDGAVGGISAADFYSQEKANFLPAVEAAFADANWLEEDLNFYDLSLSKFQWADMQPQPNFDCAEPFPIKEFNYTCNTYDPGHGPGIWLNTSYIENQIFEWRPPGGFIESYWKMDTPYFCGEFGRKSRIYIERVGGNSLDNFSWVYADTRPDVPENISVDKNFFTGDSYLSFYDNDYLDSAAYHIFSDSAIKSSFPFLDVNVDKKQSREFLDSALDANGDAIDDPALQEDRMLEIADAQRVIGYNNILGDIPSHTKGRILTNDVSFACHNNLTDFWQTVDFLKGTNPSGESFELDFTDDIPKIKNIPREWALKELHIGFSLPPTETITTDEAYATIYFEDVDESINNFLLTPTGGLSVGGSGEYLLRLDCQYYNSETIQLIGKSWKKLKITSVMGVVADTFDVNDVKIKEGQTSIIDDGLGRILVFFSDSLNSNISVALTFNEGRNWVIYRDILRLTSNEIATLPVAYQDTSTSAINLFYVLNDSFLMYTSINADKLDCEDSFVNYKAPDFYDETSIDDNEKNPESSLFPYTKNGQSLRRGVSYFVAGNAEEIFFIDQMKITEDIRAKNAANKNPDIPPQHIRFDYAGDLEDLDDTYNGKPFGVNRDNRGILRIFYAGEEGMTIKTSTNYQRWEYVSKNLPLHRTYLVDDIKEESNPVVSNIQIARNYYDEDFIYLFYFYRGMLLMRILPPGLLTIKIDEDGNRDDTKLRKFLQIEQEFYGFRPIFISGKIPDDILKVRVDELEEEDATGNTIVSKVAINFPYGLDDIKKFDINFELDGSTQVFAYTTAEGTVRVFYKDAFGNLNGAYINGENTTPEIFYEIKQELIK